jgi:LytS/YehU family sensor histidine kinase
LLLQPLVENAVRHGVATLVDGGTVRIAAARSGDRVEIVVENPFDPDGRRGGTGVGLANVRERLDATYRGLASVRAETIAAADPIFRVSVSVPASSGAVSEE